MLSKIEDDKFLGLKVIGVLVNVIWDKIYPRILRNIFLPYMVYFLSFLLYVTFFYDFDNEKKNNIAGYILYPVSIFFSLRQLYYEFWQFKDEGFNYFNNMGVIWNILDLCSSVLVITFAVVDLLHIDWGENIIMIAALAVFFLWLKLFYFLRLFKPTSSFIRMIVEMFYDIRIFLLIFFIGILSFSNLIYIMDFIKLEKEGEDGGIEEVGITGENYFDSFVYIYATGLGEFSTDDLNDHPYMAVYWFIFFGTTIFLLITLLNLLIQIMSDTFDRVLDVAKESQLKEICSFISEYYYLFPQEDFTKNSMVVVASLDSGETKVASTWEGKLGALKQHFQNALANVDTKLIKMNDLIHIDSEKVGKNV
jgi:hypothetical protein